MVDEQANEDKQEQINWHRMLGVFLNILFKLSQYNMALEKELSLKQQLLDIAISKHPDGQYNIELEKELSLKRQFLDIALLKRPDGKGLPIQQLPDGFDNLREHNLITFKSHQETLDRTAILELYGHFINYTKQCADQDKAEKHNKVDLDSNCQLYAISARTPEKLFQQGTFKEVQEGVYDFELLQFKTRIIVTSEVALAPRNVIWLLFSGKRERVAYGAIHYPLKKMLYNQLIQRMFRYFNLEELLQKMAFDVDKFCEGLMEEALEELTQQQIRRAVAMKLDKGEEVNEVVDVLPMAKRIEGVPVEKLMEVVPAEKLMEGILERWDEQEIQKLEQMFVDLRKKH